MGRARVDVRPECPDDVEAIRALTDDAFGRVGDESAIIDRLRTSDRWLADLSLVAVVASGRVVGHCVTSVGDLVGPDGSIRPILTLGPISVIPDRQGEGIGAALIEATIDRATQAGWPVIVLLGHATYYPRFGFESARRLGLEPQAPWSDDHWLALRLPGWTPGLRGLVRFPVAFGID